MQALLANTSNCRLTYAQVLFLHISICRLLSIDEAARYILQIISYSHQLKIEGKKSSCFFFVGVSVTVHCKDTRIAVQVKTNKPFNGRIYALGRSETCNIDVVNSDLFRLDLTMSGQDCNTQSVVCN